MIEIMSRTPSGTEDRREFLRRSFFGFSAASTFPLFLGRGAQAAAESGHPDDDRILVVLQLSGGNDGLSTVIPHADPVYGRSRSQTRIAEDEVLKINDYLGLHPALRELRDHYDNGRMAIVQGVSYPNPNRSHFESMDVWHAGDDSGSRQGNGWIGRAVDSTCKNCDNPFLTVNLGHDSPLALMGDHHKPISVPSHRGRGRGRRRSRKNDPLLSRTRASDQPNAGNAALRELDFLVRVTTEAEKAFRTIRSAVNGFRPHVDFPRGNPLARDLLNVSAMIESGLPTRVYYVSLGGFDTHANQRNRHNQLMRNVSGALDAFMKELEAGGHLDRVTVLTFTEFGRRVSENASRGTDHGVAGPVFLFGNRVRGGIHGEHPSLTDLAKGDLDMKVDFRQVYATVLEDWMGTPARKVLGAPFEKLPLLKSGRESLRF